MAPGVPARYAGAALAGREDQAELMRSAGLRPGRHSFLMLADLEVSLPTPELSDGISVESFDPRSAEELRRAYVFAHEYTVPPSGGAGPEIHVPYVGTLPPHRARGLATALLSRVLHLSREAGYVTASLTVDTANPTGALGVYERAGFREVYRQDSYHLDE